ncbi:MAG: YbbR-like domain-containing protein [Candidatus Latescibacterota bacterium]
MSRIEWGNWGTRAGALGLALLLWLYVVTEHRYEKEVDARLHVDEPRPSGSDLRELVVSSAVPPRVRVLASGRGKDLLQLGTDDLLVRLRPEVPPGSERTYRLTPSQVEVRPGGGDVKIEEVISPKEVGIAVDYRGEREVPVRAVVVVRPAEAYVQVGTTQVTPTQVRIAGPSDLLAQIEGIDTDSLVLTEVHEDVDLPVRVRLPADLPIEVRPAHVRVRADIQILAEDDISQVPVRVRHAASRSVEAQPARVQVRVRGGVDVVANLDATSDLDLYVDYRAYSGDPLSVLADPNPRFQIVEIAPARVDLLVH